MIRPRMLFSLLAFCQVFRETEAVYVPGLLRLFRLEGDLEDASSFGEDVAPIVYSATDNGVSFVTDNPYGSQARQVMNLDGGKVIGSASGLPGGDAPRTVLGWFNMMSTATNNGPFGYGSTAGGRAFYGDINGLQLWLDYMGIDEGVNPVIDPIIVNQWYHVAFVWDGSVNRAHVNGQLVKEGTPSVRPDTQVDNNAVVNMGGGPDLGGGQFFGRMADFAIFDRALTNEEVLSIYNDPTGLEATETSTDSPTTSPTDTPTMSPTNSPTDTPTLAPTGNPSNPPSITLAEKFDWKITPLNNGTLSGQSSLVMAYNISNRYYSFDVFEADCITRVEGALEESEIVTSLGNGFVNVTASINIDQEAIENYPSIWNGSVNGGAINFCVAISLLLGEGEEDVVINFMETIYTINVDKTTGFVLEDIVAERVGPADGGENVIDYEETITTFQCNDSYNEVLPVPVLSQGDVLQVCVLVEDNASIFEIDYIDAMNVTQDGNSDSPVLVLSNQTEFAYEDLTVTECNGSVNQICRIKFQLLASFFDTADPPNLVVSGIVKLKLKTTSDRHLVQSVDNVIQNHGRSLTNDEKENSFMLDIELQNVNDSGTCDMYGEMVSAILAISGAYYAYW